MLYRVAAFQQTQTVYINLFYSFSLVIEFAQCVSSIFEIFDIFDNSLNTKKEMNDVVFTYTTVWYLDTATKWSERWDIYFDDASRDNEIHWFSIFNSLLIVLFLSAMVAMILTRGKYKYLSEGASIA